MILGIVLVVMVLFLPKGLIGTLLDIQYRRRLGRSPGAEPKEE